MARRSGGYPLLQFFTWATMGCFNPYVAIILTDRGLDNTRIGLVLTLNAVVSILAQPAWGLVSDKIRSVRKVFIFCLAVAGLLILLLPWARSLSQLVVLYPLILFFLSPLAPLLDVWTYQGVSNHPHSSYGQLRLFGSLGFAVFVIPLGRLVSMWGLNVTSYGFALLAVVSMVISLDLAPVRANEQTVMRPRLLPQLRLLLGQYRYVSFLVILFLAFLAIQPMFGFHARLMLSVGGTQEQFVWTMALAALSEIPVFLWSKKLLARFRPVRLLVFSLFVFILRLTAYALVREAWQVTAIGLTHGVSFALFLIALVHYIDELAPEGLKSSALTIDSAGYVGLSGMAGNALAVCLMDRLEIQPVYGIGALVVLAALALFLLSLLPGRQKKHRQADP
ncbi:MAG: MFS transporter [Clostridiaceae bacterium]|nr:MFS transporter [Clostridiaceae bacterium]